MAGSGRWQSQAAADAALKFAPQKSSLGESLREAQEAYKQTVQAGNSTARLTQSAAKSAIPQIAGIYSGATAAQNAGTTLVNKDLAALPGVADQYKADQAGEAATQLSNLLAASSRDRSMLHQQGVAAQAGAQFNQTQARSTLQKTLATLLSKGNTVSQEQGAFAATEAEKLAHEAESNEQKERASERSAGTSRANAQESNAEKRAAAGASQVNGVKLLPGESQQKAASTINSIRGLATAIFKEGHDRAQAVKALTEAEPSIKLKTGGTLAGRSAYSPDVLMSAALDEAQFGHVTNHTLSRLHEAGYSIKQLGLKGPAALPTPGQLGKRVQQAIRF